jgi:hypothetical protein
VPSTGRRHARTNGELSSKDTFWLADAARDDVGDPWRIQLMLDASGRYRFRYEDVFRALGNYVDGNKFKDVTIVETAEGFLIKGQVVEETSDGWTSSPATYLFTNDDLDAILEQAYNRRNESN